MHDEAPATRRRGLVLAGGGAKGAFSFGCLKAFHEKGITFDAVSGTSVGALNGLLWSTASIDDGHRIWSTISYSSVYPITPSLSATLPNWIAFSIALGFVCLRVALSSLIRLPVPGDRWFYAGWTLLAFLPTSVFFMMKPISRRDIPILLLYLILGTGTFYQLCRRRKSGQFLLLMIGTGNPFSIALGMAIIAGLLSPSIQALYSFLLLLAMLAVGYWCFRVCRWILEPHVAVMSSTPLAAVLREVIRNKTFTCSMFATAAYAADVWDPEKCRWHPDPGAMTPTAMGLTPHDPATEMEWLPEYLRLDGQCVERIVDGCLASAALPYGLIPSVLRDRSVLVDGGVVDNVPLFPLLALDAPLDEVFVVLLQPYPSDEAALAIKCLTPDYWSELDRLIRVSSMTIPPSTIGEPERQKYKRSVPSRPVPSWPRLRVFYPPESLGGLRGSLRFESDFAQRLVELGYQTATAKLNHDQPVLGAQ